MDYKNNFKEIVISAIISVLILYSLFVFSKNNDHHITMPLKNSYSIICIENQEYVRFQSGIANKLDEDGKPIKCQQKKEEF